MPRPALPPTPGSSSDLKGQEQHHAALQFQSFELPPPAMTGDGSRPSSAQKSASADTSANQPASPKSTYPVQPSETVKSRRRSLAAQAQKDSFVLPPPPTRSRKIIQMKPRQEEPAQTLNLSKSSGSKKVAAETASSAGGKKKQPSATSAAGRKIARKTAHSLIERRRRSKMNEEFAVLKSLIPACTGEMHKLAILQASIEYIRYLDECVKTLQEQQANSTNASSQPPTPATYEIGQPTSASAPQNRQNRPYNPISAYTDTSGDVEMTGSEAPSPVCTSAASSVHQPSVSPALLPEGHRPRHDSYSSLTADQRNYSYAGSTATSPAFGPQTSSYGSATPAMYMQNNYSATGSTLASPALNPQRDLDQEATAALLMLNSDRRGTVDSVARSRRMSVRDLLSS